MTIGNGTNGNKKFVGIAEVALSRNPSDTLVASNLGSCLGVAVYDPVAKIGGVAHLLLPLSKTDPAKARANPYMYVDSGVAALLRELFKAGSKKGNWIIKVAGGSNINDQNEYFQVGKRNHTVLRKLLWKNDLLVAAESIGGNRPRTLSLEIGSGDVFIKSPGEDPKPL